MEDNQPSNCCACGKSFKQRSGLFKHSKKCGKASSIFSPLSRKSCKEEDCNYTYRYNQELRTHLIKDHKLNIVSETLMFKCYEDFLIWKEEYEKKTISSFTRNNAKKVKHGGRSTEYFYCHRSGQYRCMSKGKRRLKAQGSLKINNTCTAALKVTILPNNTVRVYVCHTHYGHKMDLIHVKISKKDRELLAAQMSQGVPKENILHTLSASNAVSIERKHLIMRKDLNNISRAFGVKSNCERVKQYRLSVDDFFQDVIREGTASVLLYKKRKEEVFIIPESTVCPLQSHDFAFGFMNQFQQEIFHSYGNGVICFDSTSDCGGDVTVQHELPLLESLKIFSVVVIDDYGDGIPVAWLISNREDDTILTLFFELIKNLTGPITPKAILTNRTSNCYDCWINVFGGEPMKLLCSWHVYNEWREKISQLEDQDAATDCYQVLCLLLEEQDLTKFVILMQRCIKEMNDNESLMIFGRYFCDEWAAIQEQWAACFRSSFSIDTSLHMESIHQTFKHLFIQEKFRKSPNKCLNLVLNFCSDLNMKRHEKHEQEKTKLVENHRLVEVMSLDLVKQVSPTTWYVTTDENVYGTVDDSSGNTYSLVHIVEEVCELCTRVCNVRCACCQVCMHLFKCSCNDSKPGIEICDHIHLVAHAKMQDGVTETEEGNIVLHEDPNAMDIGMLDHNYFEVTPKENACSSASEKNDKEQNFLSSTNDFQQPCDSLNTSLLVPYKPENCLGVYAFPKPDQPVQVQVPPDRHLGVPILPKPPENPTGKLLGIIIIPDSTQKPEPNIEVLKDTLFQGLDTIAAKIESCTNRNTLLALQNHINAAISTFGTNGINTTTNCPNIVHVAPHDMDKLTVK